MIETYKFRLYPNSEQEVLLAKHFGHIRFVYNWALDFNTKQYAQTKKHLGWMTIASSGEYKKLKADNTWLYEVGATSLQNAIGHLDTAFQKFFRGQGGFPKYKSKFNDVQSFEVPKGLQLFFKDGKIQIPKFLKTKNEDNRIKCVFCRKVKPGKIGTATISRNAAHQYFVSFIVHTAEPEAKPMDKSELNLTNSIGIDFGLKHFLTLSDGRVFESPEFFKHTLEKLAWEQRKLSRKKKGSNNRFKQKIKVAKLHQKISNQRDDYLHNLSCRLADESQVGAVCIEDLNLKGMSKLWGRKVNDLSYGKFTAMLEYKLKKRGKLLLKIGRFDPSSQICSKCGHRQRMPLEERTYLCTECGMSLDRDINAAINIRNFALRNVIKNLNTDATSGINACGDGTSGGAGKTAPLSPVSEAGKSGGLHTANHSRLQRLGS